MLEVAEQYDMFTLLAKDCCASPPYGCDRFDYSRTVPGTDCLYPEAPAGRTAVRLRLSQSRSAACSLLAWGVLQPAAGRRRISTTRPAGHTGGERPIHQLW